MKEPTEVTSGGKREGAGRPPKGSKAFPALYVVRCFHSEREAWKRAATKDGKPLSDWVRDTLNDASKH